LSKVLVVEDEEHLAEGLRFNIENAGYEVHLVGTGPEALQIVADGSVDLIVLDVSLPGGMDGFEVARQIRREGSFMPIVMLTARDGMVDRVHGLDAGADDYLTKPFDLDELLARIRVHLRRQVWNRKENDSSQDERTAPPPPPLEFGDCCVVDFETYRAQSHDGREVQLSWKEAEMMRLFSEQEGKVVSRAAFLEKVWGEPGTLETRTVDNFILRLRKLFEPDPKQPRHIHSVRGVGYRFTR
jgi:two-component system, OmpR family, alkaline phosphatase synthesis response regulator PhoP